MSADRVTIRRAKPEDFEEWLRMRWALWPDDSEGEMRAEMEEIQADPNQPVFVVERPDSRLGGFLEASLRSYADGCRTRQVGYLEGWYVDRDMRQQGVGGWLVEAAEDWAREMGCLEMASDCEIWNDTSLAAHLALGYEEVGRVIQFCKDLVRG